MKLKKSPAVFYILALGAINGLLVGLALEEMRITYLVHEMTKARQDFIEHHNWTVDFFYPTRGVFVPFVCIVAFAGVSHLVHRYFINCPQALLLFWLIFSSFAVWAGHFMESSSPNAFSFTYVLIFAFVSYIAHRFWKNHLQSFPLLWLIIGISAVIVVAASVQLVGLFMVQRRELRSPLMWLLCLAGIVVINSIYGFVIQLIFPRYRRSVLNPTIISG